MKQIKVIMERSADLFCAYANNVKGITGCGETVEGAKQSLQKTIRLIKEYNTDENIPAILKEDYDLVYKYDVE